MLGIGSTELNLIILQSYAHILTSQHEASLRGSFGRHEDTRHGIVISARLGALPALHQTWAGLCTAPGTV